MPMRRRTRFSEVASLPEKGARAGDAAPCWASPVEESSSVADVSTKEPVPMVLLTNLDGLSDIRCLYLPETKEWATKPKLAGRSAILSAQ